MDAWKIQSSKNILLCLYGNDLFKKKVFSLSKYRKIIPPCIFQRQKIILNESVIHLTVHVRCLCVDRKFDFRRVTDADMEYV